jgi:hypothetical protein
VSRLFDVAQLAARGLTVALRRMCAGNKTDGQTLGRQDIPTLTTADMSWPDGSRARAAFVQKGKREAAPGQPCDGTHHDGHRTIGAAHVTSGMEGAAAWLQQAEYAKGAIAALVQVSATYPVHKVRLRRPLVPWLFDLIRSRVIHSKFHTFRALPSVWGLCTRHVAVGEGWQGAFGPVCGAVRVGRVVRVALRRSL